jgi:RecB family exonuclease
VPLIEVSPTKLDAWQECPFRYRLSYVDRVAVDGSWAHLSMGNAIHAALRDWFDLEEPERDPSEAGRLVGRHWSALGFMDADQSQQWQQISAGMVEAYCRQHPAPTPHSRERTISALGTSVRVRGRVDRIDERDGELVIVDYKTGRHVPTDEDARVSRALAIYAAVAQRALRRPVWTVELHHVPSGVIARHRHTPESLSRQMARVESIGRDIAAAEEKGDDVSFPASPGPLCAWCDFREHCPDSAAVPAVPRWAGLPEAPD